MAPDEPTHDGPSIEPPTLGFGFRRKKKSDRATDEAATEALPVVDGAPETEQTAPSGSRPGTIFDSVAGSARPPTAAREPVAVVQSEPEPADDTPTETFVPSPPVAVVEPGTPVEDLSPAGPTLRRRGMAPKHADTSRHADLPHASRSEAAATPVSRTVAQAGDLLNGLKDLVLPGWYQGRNAAMVTGLVVGVVVAVATALALGLCEAVQGTSSCGRAGFFLLVAILIGGVLVGASLLRLADVPDPGSTSFLAVGLMAVVALLFLVGSIFSGWMIVVVPLVCVGTFALSHWVTTSFVDNDS